MTKETFSEAFSYLFNKYSIYIFIIYNFLYINLFYVYLF